MNRFLYAEANPTTLVDPDGHTGICEYIVTDASCWDTGTGKDTGNSSAKTPATPPPASMTPAVNNVPSPDDLERATLEVCLETGGSIEDCLRKWMKFVNDSPNQTVTVVAGAMSVPADLAKNLLWKGRYENLVDIFKARGWSEASADKVAAAFVRQQFKGGEGLMLTDLTDRLAWAGIAIDVGYTGITCDWKDGLNCVSQTAKTVASDYAGWQAGRAVMTGCVALVETGPLDLGCVAAAVGTGIGVQNVVSSAWANIGCNFDNDCPKLDDYLKAAKLLSEDPSFKATK